MITVPASGNCQCEAVRYEVTANPFVQYTCHCSECQKLSSSAFSTCMQVPSESVRVISGQPKLRDRATDSGNRLTASFCGECGSVLFAQNSARPRLLTVFVGTLERPHDVEVNTHIWMRSKLPWVEVPKGHRQFDQAADWSQDYVNAPERLES